MKQDNEILLIRLQRGKETYGNASNPSCWTESCKSP